eukprot:scaffold279_cov116-Isochrysis_galbana.AAC.5
MVEMCTCPPASPALVTSTLPDTMTSSSSLCSCSSERDLRISTERSVRRSCRDDDLISTARNDRRSIAHSEPAETQVTVAARGLLCKMASSPKHGLVPADVAYFITSTGGAPSAGVMVTAYSPESTM